MILAWTGDELSCREAQNGVTFDFEVKFDLEGQGQSPPKTIGILTKVFYTYGPNLVILAWTGDELSRGQASDYRTHGRTDTQTDAGNDNTRRPKLASGKKPIANRRVEDPWKPAMVTLKIQPNCSTDHDTTLWTNIFERSHLVCGTDSRFHMFMQVSQIFQRRKSNANKQDFEN